MTHGDIPEFVRDRIRRELPANLAASVLETDVRGESIGVLGVDAENRIVFYADDCAVIRRPITEYGIGGSDHPDYQIHTPEISPHTAENVVHELDTEDWLWVHPRYRWVLDADSRQHLANFSHTGP